MSWKLSVSMNGKTTMSDISRVDDKEIDITRAQCAEPDNQWCIVIDDGDTLLIATPIGTGPDMFAVALLYQRVT